MTGYITVQEIFNAAGLLPCGPVSWGTPIPERSGGVYLIELMQPKERDGQSIIYVGRIKRSLRRRMREFYKHRYGEKRPHSGGQAILKVRPFAMDLLGTYRRMRRCRRQNDRAISEVGREAAIRQSNAIGTRVSRRL